MRVLKLNALAITFAFGGVWDTIAGFIYIFAIGTNRMISQPEVDPFYSIFLGSFFLCFAYLQILSSFNIKRYIFNVGCLIFGRFFYVVLLYGFMVFKKDFPATFWFTGIIDGSFLIAYVIIALRSGFSVRDLFLPKLQ
ncbi:hypothetical protein DSECCO2_87390 [anaerobic digester metagenome]